MAGAPQEQAGRLQRGLDPKLKGVVVSEVARDGLAANAGLLQGDVIIELDKKAVGDGSQAAGALGAEKSHLVRVRTAKGTRFVTLPK